MTKIYFVRHAKVEYTEDDRTRALTSQGREDTKLVTEAFNDIAIDKMISSPYVRAVDTIKGVAEQKGLEIETFDDLRERKVAHGFIDDFMTFAQNQWNDFDFKLDGGESLNEVRARGVKQINVILKANEGKNLVIGTHGTFLGVMLNYYDSKHDFEFWKTLQMPDIFMVEFEGEKVSRILNIEY